VAGDARESVVWRSQHVVLIVVIVNTGNGYTDNNGQMA